MKILLMEFKLMKNMSLGQAQLFQMLLGNIDLDFEK